MGTTLKDTARLLRRQGRTYSEIQQMLGVCVPKGTLSGWLCDIKLGASESERIRNITNANLEKARRAAVQARKKVQDRIMQELREEFADPLRKLSVEHAKLLMAMLYMGEGGKSARGSVMLGNSDPKIIVIFLRLLRSCYPIDEAKFRCTVQCRYDQDVEELESFWSEITNISRNQFYKAYKDKRTIGKATNKKEYKGVLRIDYFSAKIFKEMMLLPQIIREGL